MSNVAPNAAPTAAPPQTASLDRALMVLVCGFLALAVSFGVRVNFGFFLVPISEDMAWSITTLSFMLAVQNLMWGAMQPFAGALADRFGAAKVVAGGALLYSSGLIVMAVSDNPFAFGAGAGVMIGAAQAAMGFPVILGAIGRTTPAGSRSMLTGIAVAGGSFGQLVFAPIGQQLVAALGWLDALWFLSALAAGAAVLGLGMLREIRKPRTQAPGAAPTREVFGAPQTMIQAAAQAMRHRGFLLLTAGFFVCGFQLAFISVHLPQFAVICGLAPVTAATGLALIGGFNIIGTIAAGWLGGRFIPKYPLAVIYFLRGLVCLMMVLLPVTETVLYAFSVCMGLLWLSTVPLTNTIVGRMFGQQHVGMLFGVVFFSHQLGSFIGLWLAGAAFDATGSYDLMWWLSAALGLFAALVNLPINDARVNPAPAAA